MKTYLVGGAVRDTLLGITPKDRDWVIVGASAADVDSLLREGYKQVGADFPVFLHPETGEEYALARIERKVGAGYHGFKVDTAGVTIEDDLSRRDITINAMAMDMQTGQIIDPFGGAKDLRDGVIRHTTAAFSEDPLRVLRVARFAARYDFTVAAETLSLCQEMVARGELTELSHERIWLELQKGLETRFPLLFLDWLDRIFASVDQVHPVIDSLFQRETHRAITSELSRKLVQTCGELKLTRPVTPEIVLALVVQAVNVPGISNEQRQLIKASMLAPQSTDGAADILAFITEFGILKNDPISEPVKQLCDIRRQVIPGTLGKQALEHLASEIRAITAAQFPDLKGPALGQAIKQRRMLHIEDVLKQGV